MTPAAQLHAALKLTLNRKGHLDSCGHGQWLQSWSFDTRHECDVEGCRRTGQPCSKPCQAVRAALKLDVAEQARAVERPRDLFSALEAVG